MWWWLLLGYVPDETPREREKEGESNLMWWWLLLGYVPDELLSVLLM